MKGDALASTGLPLPAARMEGAGCGASGAAKGAQCAAESIFEKEER